MKTILLLFLTSSLSFAQTLDLTENITIGTNCGNGQTTERTYEQVNLNNFTITLRNADFRVTGNLNGPGEITRCGNFDHSSVCVSGAVQNQPNLNGIRCNTLSNNNFELSSETIGLDYKVYDLTGREIKSGKVNDNFYRELPEIKIVIVKVDGYAAFKYFKQWNGY